MSNPVVPSVGSTPVSEIYTAVCYVMLEDFGLVLQLTEQQFLDMLQLVYLDWLQRTELVQTIYTQVAHFATGQYAVPDEIIRPLHVLYDGLLLSRTERFSLDNRGRWRDVVGEPQVWHEDGLPLKTIEIVEQPRYEGVDMDPTFGDFFAGNAEISIVGPVRPTGITLATSSILDLIPDPFTPYLGYGVLHRFFSQDGETKDLDRAQYCRARYEEGFNLAQAISNNDLQGEEE